jgi:hypothetical protein
MFDKPNRNIIPRFTVFLSVVCFVFSPSIRSSLAKEIMVNEMVHQQVQGPKTMSGLEGEENSNRRAQSVYSSRKNWIGYCLGTKPRGITADHSIMSVQLREDWNLEKLRKPFECLFEGVELFDELDLIFRAPGRFLIYPEIRKLYASKSDEEKIYSAVGFIGNQLIFATGNVIPPSTIVMFGEYKPAKKILRFRSLSARQQDERKYNDVMFDLFSEDEFGSDGSFYIENFELSGYKSYFSEPRYGAFYKEQLAIRKDNGEYITVDSPSNGTHCMTWNEYFNLAGTSGLKYIFRKAIASNSKDVVCPDF